MNLTTEQIDQFAESFKQVRESCFKPREFNEKYCFDLAVGAFLRVLMKERPNFTRESAVAFCAKVGLTFVPQGVEF